MRLTLPLCATILLFIPNSFTAAGPADDILAESGVKGGLVIELGCGDGTRAVALAANERFTVHGYDADAGNVAKARTLVRRKNLAARVWMDPIRSNSLPYAENMVNLLVADPLGDIPLEEVRRVLAPLGVALTRSGAKWEKWVKPWPEEMDEWSHWMHEPDGNAVANDTLAGPPRRLKWIAGPLWSRSHDSVPSVTSMVSAGGRMFYIVDEAPASMSGAVPDKWSLVARDAFNGLELWREPIPEWGWKSWADQFTVRFTIPKHVPRRLVATADRVYVTLGFNAPLTELDAATGETLRVFEDTENTDEILCLGETLIVAINKGFQKPGNKREDSPPPLRKWVAAIEIATGKMLWKTGDFVGLRSKTGAMERISHLSMSAGGGGIFFVDGDQMICLNVADGSERWRVARPVVAENKMRYDIRVTDLCTLVYHDDMLYFAQLNPDRKIDWREILGKLHAFSAKNGEELWSRECSSWGWAHPADVFVMRDLVWVSGFKDEVYHGLDLKTGAERKKVSNKKAFDNGHHHRCYINKATENYLITSFRGLEFIGLDAPETDRNHWVRGTCRLGVMPCNGMIYANPHPCDCYMTSKLNGFLGLLPEAKGEMAEPPDSKRLEKGPAYGKPAPITDREKTENWPTYRHDSQRRSATKATIALTLEPLWKKNLGGPITSPVVAEGRLVVARKEGREVIAFDASDGKEQWRFVPGGALDTPPTLYAGRVIFGCADGRLYCLRATDGALTWRFQAAPADRLIGAFGSIESAWPLHGSVLVQDGKVYCTAGRSSFLDGGIRAWALDVETGNILSREILSDKQDMDVEWGRDQRIDTGLLSDLLVAADDGIFMRQRPMFGAKSEAGRARQFHATSGLLDDSWFHRARWFLGGEAFGEYLVFNDSGVYGARARESIGGYGGHFTPGTEGFEIFASDLVEPSRRKPMPTKTPKPRKLNPAQPAGNSQTPTARAPKSRWSVREPIRVSAMVLAGDTLLVGGSPDVIIPGDPWAAYEGRKGGKLLVISTLDGMVRARMDLGAPPILDGMAVAGGRLYVSDADGGIVCLGGN